MADDDRYRLEPVRAGRARDEAAARGDLADAVGDARATEAATAAGDRRVAAARERLERALAEATTAARATVANCLAQHDRFVARLRAALDVELAAAARLASSHRDRLGAVDHQRARLAAARAQKEVIERHFARWRADRRKLAERRED